MFPASKVHYFDISQFFVFFSSFPSNSLLLLLLFINFIIIFFFSEQAIELMEAALDGYVVQGLACNIAFLRAVYRNPKYALLDRCLIKE